MFTVHDKSTLKKYINIHATCSIINIILNVGDKQIWYQLRETEQ